MVGPIDQEKAATENIVGSSSQIPRLGACLAMQGPTEKQLGWSGGRGNLVEKVSRAFIVVSLRRNRGGRGSRLRISQCEHALQAPGTQRLSGGVYYLALG